MIIKQAIGIDASKDKFDVCFSTTDINQNIKIKSTRKFSQSKEGLQEFKKWIIKFSDPKITLVCIIEATGVYHENITWFLFKNEFNISVILPSRAKKHKASTAYKTKTDKVDAKALAQYGLERKTEPWNPLSKNIYRLRRLTRELDALNQERTGIKNKLHALKHSIYQEKSSLKRLQQHLLFIEKQILQSKLSIDSLIKEDEKLKNKVDQLSSIHGVGTITVATIIAETNGFALIKSQGQLISYAGLDVVKKDSGSIISKGRISKRGNTRLRKVLLMAGFNVVRYEVPIFKNLYKRLTQKGKPKMLAYVAIHKKLLITLWALWKNDARFDPLFYQNFAAVNTQKLLENTN